ncbi:MAG: NCS2 family permease [Erysipelotrichaceae bacterium]|jgi:AGZA family xanthine/uracil permease-like MFS transporter|nr:NCS2 family permease [Erysipelotrichaceae bacterium]
MNNFFKLKENNTSFNTELMAGLTTFFTMSYILIVNPTILGESGLAWGAVFLATVFASAIGTLVMGLFANVPYALAPGMGINAFFTYTIVFTLGYTPYEGLAMVFICGLINIFITTTRIRKHIIKAIPESLQHAIGGGIGIFIAYIGLLNVGLINFGAGVPALAAFDNPVAVLTLIGLFVTVVLLILKVKGAMLIGIITATIVAIPLGLVNFSSVSFDLSVYSGYFGELGNVFAKCVTDGIPSLFADPARFGSVFAIIFSFSLTDTFDTIGTFIGTGRRSGIFSAEDEKALEEGKGFSSKMDKALFADAIATSMGAFLGTSNTTTYVESAAGIEAGGRTGLTSVVVSICFLLSILLSPIISLIPSAATAPALIIVGVLMIASFKDVKWDNFEEALPAFFAGTMMALAYSVSEGIALGFIFYLVVQVVKGKASQAHPILWVSSLLFAANYLLKALGMS